MKTFLDVVMQPSTFKRALFFLILDAFIVALSLYLSFLVYFELHGNVDYWKIIWEVLPCFIVVKIGFVVVFRVYKITWRYFGIIDLFTMIMALAASSMFLAVASFEWTSFPLLASMTGFPKSIIFMDFTVSLVLLSFVRVSKRFYLEVVRDRRHSRTDKRTLILGAGNTGEMVLRDMQRRASSGFSPVGFLDDDDVKDGAYIHGVRVQGKLRDLENVIGKREIEALVIAIPSLDRKMLGELYSTAKRMKVETVKIVPRIYDFNKPHVNLRSLEDISLEDLVGRQSVTVDRVEISEFLRGKRVLITGAGGSIGSEIAVQVCGFEPARLMLFDIDETDLHNLWLRLSRLFPESAHINEFITGDIRDGERIREVFEGCSPQIVFHAAAYKHVPMMEFNAGEAVKVNMFGTYTVAGAAVENGVEKFVMISSDKAVRPTSVMGATKRMAEYICGAYNDEGISNFGLPILNLERSVNTKSRNNSENETTIGANSRLTAIRDETNRKSEIENPKSSTKFISVRFGNVLGSRGSVLPLFLDQLKHGGPLTVTHRDMKRYFMTIPEAVSLVLQASVIGNGGEVLVLDMGEPVSITEIAEELIRMHGLEPGKDIDIEYTGLRPGEKLFEEILTAEEGTDASKHEKIFVARNGKRYSGEEIQKILNEFGLVLSEPSRGNGEPIKSLLRKYVKYYEEESRLELGDRRSEVVWSKSYGEQAIQKPKGEKEVVRWSKEVAG